jgi:putative oxidoreductase
MQKLIDLCKSGYQGFISLSKYGQCALLLAVRLYWGWQFAQTGWGKLHHLDHVTAFFTSLGIPAPGPTALFVGLVEFAGGILFALGFGSRLVSLVLFLNMTVAYWTADREAFLGVLSAPDKFFAADPYTFWFAALLILVFGPGLIAVDTLIGRWFGVKGKG